MMLVDDGLFTPIPLPATLVALAKQLLAKRARHCLNREPRCPRARLARLQMKYGPPCPSQPVGLVHHVHRQKRRNFAAF